MRKQILTYDRALGKTAHAIASVGSRCQIASKLWQPHLWAHPDRLALEADAAAHSLQSRHWSPAVVICSQCVLDSWL
jgi:hypothetical protein